MSPLRHDAPPPAWQSLGLAAPGTGAARPVRVLSGTRHAPHNTATDHAGSGKVGVDLQGVHRAAEHACRFVRLQKLSELWWQSAMPRERSAYPLRAEYAQVTRRALRATPALDGGGQSLRHGRSAR